MLKTIPLAAGFLCAVLFMEILPENLLRGGYWENGGLVWDATTRFRLTPGPHYCSSLFAFRARLEIGADGFRCLHSLDRSSSHPIRVLILGHSQPFSAGCDEEDALHTRLVEDLDARHSVGAICYNLALPGNELPGQYALLTKYAPLLKPTHVVYWGAEKAKPRIWDQTVQETKNDIIGGYYSNGWLTDSRVLAWSRLLRWFGCWKIWETFTIRRKLPRFYPGSWNKKVKAILIHAPETKAASENKTPQAQVSPTTKSVTGEDVMDAACLDRYCRAIGAKFIQIHDKDRHSWDAYPTDDHLTPKGIQELSVLLSDKIVGATP